MHATIIISKKYNRVITEATSVVIFLRVFAQMFALYAMFNRINEFLHYIKNKFRQNNQVINKIIDVAIYLSAYMISAECCYLLKN